MSTLLFPIGINIQEINNVFGSKNQHLYDRFITSAVYVKFDEAYSFRRELEGLIFSYVVQQNRVVKPAKFFGLIKGDDGRGLEGEWFEYAYALLVICYELGEQFINLDEELELESEWNDFTKLLNLSTPMFDSETFLNSKAIFDIPFKQDDEIITAFLNEGQLHQLKMSLENITAQPKHANNKFVVLFKKCVEVCLNKKLDLILFSFEKAED